MVEPPLWKIWVRQLGSWLSQLFLESHSKFHGSSHHQPGTQKIWLRTPRNMSFLWKVSWDSCYRVTSGIGSPCFRCWCVLWFVSLLRPFRYGSGNQRRVLTAKLGLSTKGWQSDDLWPFPKQDMESDCPKHGILLVFFPMGSQSRLIHTEV